MSRKNKYIGGIIGADPLPSGSPRPGVSSLGGLSADNAFEAPSLDLNFDGQASSFRRTSTSPTAPKANGDQLATEIVTQNKTGNVQSKYLGPHGKLINGYVENLVPHSTDFSTSAGWTHSSSPSLTTGQADPFGGTNATTISDNDSAGFAFIDYSVAPGSDLVFTASIFVKKQSNTVTDQVCLLRLRTGPTTGLFDLQIKPQDGSYIFNDRQGVQPTILEANREDFGDWWRFSITVGHPNYTTTTYKYQFFPTVGTSFVAPGGNFDNTATGAVTIFGAQFEVAGSPSQYVPRLDNLVPDSHPFGNSWTSQVTATNNYGTAPYGTQTSVRLVYGGSGTLQHYNTTSVVPTHGEVLTASIYYKGTGEFGLNNNQAGVPGVSTQQVFTASSVWQRAVVTHTADTSTAYGAGTMSLSLIFGGLATGSADIEIWGAQLERGSTASAFNGIAQVPRVEFDASGNPLGLLVEEERTNLMTSTDNVGGTGAGYFITSGGFTVTDDHGTAPDGTSQANRLAFGGGSFKQVNLNIGSLNITSGDVYTASVYYKATPGSSTSPNSFRLALVETGVGAITLPDLTATSEWQRAVVTRTCTNTNASAALDFRILQATSGGTDILVWGAQLEKGEGATSHIPNTATSGTATRTADDITLATSIFGFDTGTMTTMIDATISSPTHDYARFFEINNNNSSTPRHAVMLDPTNGSRFQWRDDVNGSASDAYVAMTVPLSVKIGTRTDGTTGSYAVDGAVTTHGTIPAMTSSVTQVVFGSQGTTAHMNGHIRRFTYWPRAISDASLATYTGANPPTIDLDKPTRRWGGITGRSLVDNNALPTTGVLTLAEHYQSKL